MSTEQNTPITDTLARVRQLLDAVADLLNQKQDDDLFNHAWSMLDEAGSLAGETPEVEQWRKKISELKRNYRAYQKYEETRNACEALWAQEQVLLKQNSSPNKILGDIFAKAKELAQDAAGAFSESFLLDGLKNDATFRYESAQKRYQIKTTADKTEEYEKAFKELGKMRDEGRGDELIPWFDAEGKILPATTVNDALLDLVETANTFAHSKAQEYEKHAHEALEKRHAPREAREWTHKGLGLWELQPVDSARLQTFLTKKIEPEITKLEAAAALLAQADSLGDLTRAWETVDEAVTTYAWVPQVLETRQGIAARVFSQLAGVFSDVERMYQGFMSLADLDVVQSRLAEGEALFRMVRDFLRKPENAALQQKAADLDAKASEISRKISAAREFMNDAQTELEGIQRLFAVQPEKVYSAFQEFLQTYEKTEYRQNYGDLRKRFPALEGLEARIGAAQNFETSFQALEHEFSLNAWESTLRVERNAKDIYNGEKDTSRRERLNFFLLKVQLRLDFFKAKRALTEEKNAQSAMQYLEKVAFAQGHPDQPAADALSKKLQGDKANEEKVTHALKEAQKLAEKQPGDAYRILKSMADVPTQQRDALEKSLAQARRYWEEALLSRLENALRMDYPEVQVIRDLVKDLENLPKPIADETWQRVRHALGISWSLEAKAHTLGRRWEQAQTAWQEARKQAPMVAEYEQGWRQARVQVARLSLEKAVNEQELEKILRELSQSELSEDPGVFELQAEHHYRLSQNVSLDADSRLNFLRHAESAINAALAASVAVQLDKNRLQELKKRIQADDELLKTLNGIEARMSPEASLAQLIEVKQDVTRMQAKPEISPSARDSLDKWWKNLVPRTVRALEALDDGISGDTQVWQKFNIRSKIHFLDSGNAHAQELIRAIPRQSELVLADVRAALGDRHALDIAGKKNDVLGILNAQKANMDAMRIQAQTMKEMVDRVSSALINAPMLQKEFTDALVQMEVWQREYEELRQSVLRMRGFLSQARQNNRWSDYDREHSKIVDNGMGAHRVVKILDEEKQSITTKRKQLTLLNEQIVQFAQDEKGLRLEDALNLINILENDPVRGDPEDEYNIQAELKIIDPVTNKEVYSAWEVNKWLKEHQEQIMHIVEWAASCGLWENLLQSFPLLKGQKVQPARVISWREIKPRILESLDRGKFKEVLLALDFVLNGGGVAQGAENIAFLKPYRHSLSLLQSLEKLNQPPVVAQAALTRLVTEALQMAEKYGNDEIQPVLKELNQLRERIIQKQREWQGAEEELERAGSELRLVKERINPIGKAVALREANKRVQSAILRCQEIAPKHPYLDDIERIL